MENNGFEYESHTPVEDGKYQPSAMGRPAKKARRTVTLSQLIISLVIVSLLCSGIGAGVMYLVTGIGQQPVQSAAASPADGRLVVEQSEPAAPAEASAENPAEPASKPSEGIKMSSGYESSASGPQQIIGSSMASIVGISTSSRIYDRNGNSAAEPLGTGSGVIITEDGYIVTCNHVIEGANSIAVFLQDGTEYEAELVGADAKTDLAVIKITASGLPAASLGSSGNALVGDAVFAVGNPLGVLTSSVSSGIISGLDRTIVIDDNSMTLMQTDAAVNPGNSGGGLFGEGGELIGIVNAKSYGVEVDGIGFAIPIDAAKPIIIDLIDVGYVTGRPYIGITMQDISLMNGMNGNSSYGFFFGQYGGYTTRVQVMSVAEGSAAQKADIRVNDIILALDNTEITGYTQFSSLLYEYKSGDVVTITVQRGNESIDLSVTLGERPDSGN